MRDVSHPHPPLGRFARRPALWLVALAFGLALFLWPTRPLRSDNFVFYFPSSHQLVPLEMVGQVRYLPLLKVLNLVVKVGGLQERGDSVTVWFGNTHLELHRDDKRVRVNQQPIPLPEPVLVLDGQWMVPVDFLTAVLPKFTREQVSYQIGTSRVLIGDVKPASFTARLDPLQNGARLTLQFTDQVTVSAETKDGDWIMYLGEHPVEPLEQAYQFQNPYVRQLRFNDEDGVPKLILTPAASGLNFYPSLAEGGKVLLADVLKPPPTAPEQPQPAQAPATTGSAPAAPSGLEEAPATPPGPPLPLVVLDAGHGGEESGAHSHDGVLEKDLVARLVTRVRAALLDTDKYRILLTRVGDTTSSFEQREVAANLARPAAFLTFHAGNLGAVTLRVVVYSYQAPSSLPGIKAEMPRSLLIPWIRIQETQLDRSRRLAQILQEHFAQIPGLAADPPAQAPVRQLRSVDAPAVAIEIGSLSPDTDCGPLANPDFQQQISAAIVQALGDFQRRPS
jgi:N-acetylmuramoyl-L-alanine amidase